MNTQHRNPKYLKDHLFSSNITAIGPEFPSKDTIMSANVVLFAIPTQNLRRVNHAVLFNLAIDRTVQRRATPGFLAY